MLLQRDDASVGVGLLALEAFEVEKNLLDLALLLGLKIWKKGESAARSWTRDAELTEHLLLVNSRKSLRLLK